MLRAVLFDDLDCITPLIEEEMAIKAAFIHLHGFATEVVVSEGVDLAGRGIRRRDAGQGLVTESAAVGVVLEAHAVAVRQGVALHTVIELSAIRRRGIGIGNRTGIGRWRD